MTIAMHDKVELVKASFISIASITTTEIVALQNIDLVSKILIQLAVGVFTCLYLYHKIKKIKNGNNPLND